MKRQSFKAWVVCAAVSFIAAVGSGQNMAIGLEEALSIARNNYAGLERDRLAIEQYNKLATTGLPAQPAQIYVSSEEFGSNDQSGVHSLFESNVQIPCIED